MTPPPRHGQGQRELAASARSGRRAARDAARDPPRRTHRGRAPSGPELPGRRRSEPGPNARVGTTEFPALGADCAGSGLLPRRPGPYCSPGGAREGTPPSPPARAQTGPSPLAVTTAQPASFCPKFKRGAAGAARAAIGRFEKGSARSPCALHPGGCSRSAREKDRGARVHGLHARVGCACPRCAPCLLWARSAGWWLLRARAVCTFKVGIWGAACGKGHDSDPSSSCVNGEN